MSTGMDSPVDLSVRTVFSISPSVLCPAEVIRAGLTGLAAPTVMPMASSATARTASIETIVFFLIPVSSF
ncbi:MAG: hypothetical protein BWY85_01996 [Firmicutes bacterium ADurb.Bin506]|nr:MAG: hypothetical protein BWY85_01996 [Firmicutes bacterium ADurb.Bin506]